MRNPIRKPLRTALGVVAAFALVTLGQLGLSGTASADFNFAAPHAAAPDCKDVKSTLTNRPDNGHGTGGTGTGGHWADVSGTRTVHICVDSMPLLSEKSVAVQGALFHATVSDVGTLVTLGGDHLSPNHGAKLLAGVHGTWKGGFKADFVAPAPTAPGVWPNFDASVLDGKTFVGTNGPTTGNWIKSLWKQAELTSKNWTDKYSWTYLTCNERWVDAYDNNDGQGLGAGDITGLSRVPCAVPPVFTDNCDGTVTIVLGNAAPSANAVAAYFVAGNGVVQLVVVKGQLDGKATVTVTATPGKSMPLKGQVAVALKGSKGKPSVHTYVQPKACVTPTPSPSAPTPTTSSGTAVPGLPVTGPNTGYYAAAGGVLLLAGAALVIVLRRRRVTFEA